MNLEKELIFHCKKFDPRAQKRVYEKYAPMLRGVCARYCSDYEETKDILQESFLKIFTKIEQYSGEGSFEGWMKTIVVNTALEFYRKDKKKNVVYVEEITNYELVATEDMEFLESVQVDTLLETLKGLQDEYKMVFNMFYIDDYSHKEIAVMLNIDEAASRKRLQRAKQMLKEKMKFTNLA